MAIARRTQPVSPDDDQPTRGEERTDHLRPLKVRQSWPDKDGSGDRPEEGNGCRYSQHARTVRMPLRKEGPEDPRCQLLLESPFCVPTARVTAPGPVAAKYQPDESIRCVDGPGVAQQQARTGQRPRLAAR
jgi:hypothetical protein